MHKPFQGRLGYRINRAAQAVEISVFARNGREVERVFSVLDPAIAPAPPETFVDRSRTLHGADWLK